MNASKEKIPAFFKVFIPELCSQRMQIPPAFASYMKGKLPETAVSLRDRCGSVWPVDVTREGRALYFEKGWVRFVEDNGVELGDFLVFQLNEDYFFDFKHFDKTACQKETLNETVRSFSFKNEEEKNASNDDDENEDDEEENEDDYDYEEEGDEDENEDEDDSYKEEEEILAGKIKIARSGNPCFVAKLSRRKRNDLYIPMLLVNRHKLKIPKKITIIGEDGKKFVSTIVTWTDGRMVATNGWRAFCRWNFVRKDERCECEFIDHQQLLVKIFHFHGGKWVPRQRIGTI